MLITDSLSPEAIHITDRTESAAAAIRALSQSLANALGCEPETIERAIMNRERTRTTAFANGAAIPHCRLAGLNRFASALMILQSPIRWDNEGHAVDTILMIAGPADNVSDHLRILANSSQLLDSPSFRAKLRKAPGPRQAYDLVAAAEKAVEQRRQEAGMLRELRKDQEPRGRVDYLSQVVSEFNW